MNSPKGLLRQHCLAACVVALLPLGGLSAWQWYRTHSGEPVYDGKRLSEWFFPLAWDFDWVPNDVYGHIHDEFWDRLVDPSNSQPITPQLMAGGPRNSGPPHLDTNAIPWLIRWMGTRPTHWDHTRHQVADRLPSKLAKWMDPFPDTLWGERHTRWHVAAYKAFSLLGSNATTALPALSNLLAGTDVDMPLTCAIANLGPPGMVVLTNVLTSTNAQLCDEAALALGLHYGEASMALPALMGCIERGFASYQVLGAIGRIGGEDPRLVPTLGRLLAMTNAPPGGALDEPMAILVLGLQGVRAQGALPVLRACYASATAAGDVSSQKLLRRVLKCISPQGIHLPPPAPGEVDGDWP